MSVFPRRRPQQRNKGRRVECRRIYIFEPGEAGLDREQQQEMAGINELLESSTQEGCCSTKRL